MTTQRLTSHRPRLISGAALSVSVAVGGFAWADAATTSDAPAGRLTYAKWIGENPEIFVADGVEEVQLTTDPNRDLCPAFTPDGTAIVFCSDRSGTFEIWMMNIDGTDQRQITRTGGRMLFPKVSPDGTVIAFSGATTADAPDEDSDVWVANIDGTELTQLTTAPGSDAYVTWSPDGEQIAWVSHQSGTSEIWVMNADGTNARALTEDGEPKDQLPDWSPDGSQIAYETGGDIVVMNADGTGQHTITTDPADDFGPAWSPDGTQIAFVSTRDDPQQHYVINVDGTEEHQMPNDGRVAVPDWSGSSPELAQSTPVSEPADAEPVASEPTSSLPSAADVGRRVSAVIPVANTADSIAIDDDAVWTAGWDGSSVSRVDAATNEVTTVDVGSTGTRVAVGEGGVWVGVDSGNVLRLDPVSAEVIATIDVGSGSAPTPVVGAGAVWAFGDDVVTRIDPHSDEVTDSIEVTASGLAVGDGLVWAITCTDERGNLFSIDPDTLTVADPIHLDSCASSIGFVDGAIWVGLNGERTARINPTTGDVDAILQVGPEDDAPFLATGDGGVWRPLTTSVIARIDTASNTVTEVLDLGRTGQAAGFAVGHGSLWAGDFAHQTLLRIDL